MAYISNASPLIINVQILNNTFSVPAGNYSFNKYGVSLVADTVNNKLTIRDNSIIVVMPFESVRNPIKPNLVSLFYALIPYLKIPTSFIYAIGIGEIANTCVSDTNTCGDNTSGDNSKAENIDEKNNSENLSLSVPQDLVSFTDSDACIICYTALSAGNILPGYYTLNKYNTKFGGITDLLIYNNNFKFIVPLSRITYPSFTSLADLLTQLNTYLTIPHTIVGV